MSAAQTDELGVFAIVECIIYARHSLAELLALTNTLTDDVRGPEPLRQALEMQLTHKHALSVAVQYNAMMLSRLTAQANANAKTNTVSVFAAHMSMSKYVCMYVCVCVFDVSCYYEY